MKFMLLTLLLATANSGDIEVKKNLNETVLYDDIVYQATNNCPTVKSDKVNPGLLWELIEVEKEFDVPESLKGMVLSAACLESGYNPNAKGDRKFSKDKKTPKAIGLFQMWKMYERVYKTDRTNPRSSALGWMTHITKLIPKIKRECKYRTDERIWVAAWVTGIRYPKPSGRCKEKPKHYKLLKKWHRNIKKTRKKERKEYLNFSTNSEGYGC